MRNFEKIPKKILASGGPNSTLPADFIFDL